MMRLQGEWILLLPPAQGGGAWSGLVKKQMMKRIVSLASSVCPGLGLTSRPEPSMNSLLLVPSRVSQLSPYLAVVFDF